MNCKSCDNGLDTYEEEFEQCRYCKFDETCTKCLFGNHSECIVKINNNQFCECR